MIDYSKQATCNLLYAYIYANSQRLIYEYPGDGVQAITRLQSQYANMNFSDKSIYNRLVQQVLHKGGESEIDYIKIFQNDKALEISVSNSYSKYKLMSTFLDNFRQERRYSYQIASHQAKLRREENVLIKNRYLYTLCKLIT